MLTQNIVVGSIQILISFIMYGIYKFAHNNSKQLNNQNSQYQGNNKIKLSLLLRNHFIYRHTLLLYKCMYPYYFNYQITVIFLFLLCLLKTQVLIYWPISIGILVCIISQIIQSIKNKQEINNDEQKIDRFRKYVRSIIGTIAIGGQFLLGIYLINSQYRSGYITAINFGILVGLDQLLIRPFFCLISIGIVLFINKFIKDFQKTQIYKRIKKEQQYRMKLFETSNIIINNAQFKSRQKNTSNEQLLGKILMQKIDLNQQIDQFQLQQQKNKQINLQLEKQKENTMKKMQHKLNRKKQISLFLCALNNQLQQYQVPQRLKTKIVNLSPIKKKTKYNIMQIQENKNVNQNNQCIKIQKNNKHQKQFKKQQNNQEGKIITESLQQVKIKQIKNNQKQNQTLENFQNQNIKVDIKYKEKIKYQKQKQQKRRLNQRLHINQIIKQQQLIIETSRKNTKKNKKKTSSNQKEIKGKNIILDVIDCNIYEDIQQFHLDKSSPIREISTYKTKVQKNLRNLQQKKFGNHPYLQDLPNFVKKQEIEIFNKFKEKQNQNVFTPNRKKKNSLSKKQNNKYYQIRYNSLGDQAQQIQKQNRQIYKNSQDYGLIMFNVDDL